MPTVIPAKRCLVGLACHIVYKALTVEKPYEKQNDKYQDAMLITGRLGRQIQATHGLAHSSTLTRVLLTKS